jgi:hypothetical protein
VIFNPWAVLWAGTTAAAFAPGGTVGTYPAPSSALLFGVMNVWIGAPPSDQAMN